MTKKDNGKKLWNCFKLKKLFLDLKICWIFDYSLRRDFVIFSILLFLNVPADFQESGMPNICQIGEREKVVYLKKQIFKTFRYDFHSQKGRKNSLNFAGAGQFNRIMKIYFSK